MKKHEIAVAMIMFALFMLFLAAIAGCDTKKGHHSPYPPTLKATGNCRWVNEKSETKHRILVNGKVKYVTVKVTQSKLVCH